MDLADLANNIKKSGFPSDKLPAVDLNAVNTAVEHLVIANAAVFDHTPAAGVPVPPLNTVHGISIWFPMMDESLDYSTFIRDYKMLQFDFSTQWGQTIETLKLATKHS